MYTYPPSYSMKLKLVRHHITTRIKESVKLALDFRGKVRNIGERKRGRKNERIPQK